MKKVIVIFAVIFIFGFILYTPNNEIATIQSEPSPTVTESPTVNQDASAFFKVSPEDDLVLVPNFKEKKSSNTLLEEHTCKKAINGSFYDTSDRPLGLFISQDNILRSAIKSSLLNGYIWKTKDGTMGMGTSLPTGPFIFALQSGPLLISDSTPLPLKIKDDEYRRRMVAAYTDKGFIFIALYTSDATFDGPLLADVPKRLVELNEKQQLGILTAINLDGGSASVFYDGNTVLSELTNVGSVFCLR